MFNQNKEKLHANIEGLGQNSKQNQGHKEHENPIG